jgi:glycine/D-amino acid oxidase-like deaminating enzyme
MKNTNLKPILTGLSPDDLPLVGSLKYYPNVYVNVGHGFRALTLSFACGIMIQDAICN